MFEKLLEADIARYERQLREAHDERRIRKLTQLLDATRQRLKAKREQPDERPSRRSS